MLGLETRTAVNRLPAFNTQNVLNYLWSQLFYLSVQQTVCFWMLKMVKIVCRRRYGIWSYWCYSSSSLQNEVTQHVAYAALIPSAY